MGIAGIKKRKSTLPSAGNLNFIIHAALTQLIFTLDVSLNSAPYMIGRLSSRLDFIA